MEFTRILKPEAFDAVHLALIFRKIRNSVPVDESISDLDLFNRFLQDLRGAGIID